jgi:hypothetical protein
VTTKRIFSTWWPLAASWLLMALELPALSAVVARLPEPASNLAAYGGVVFPLALIIESPVIMLLAASTALSKDWKSFVWLRRRMMAVGAALTALHLLIAFTPLYDLVVVGLLGPPEEIVEPARIGLRLMTPWTWAIAYRRFHQGVLIRFGNSRAVGTGTVIRLSADLVVLTIGFMVGTIPGIVVATSAVSAGVISEAIFAGFRVRPYLRELRALPESKDILTSNSFLSFYVPLAMTSLLTLLIQPLGAAAMSRMPRALDSLAVWPVIGGLLFMLRSLGVSFNEVVVALMDAPKAYLLLRRFATWLMLATTTALLILVATPIATLWFRQVSALSIGLATLAHSATWLALPLPAQSALQSWYQGILVFSRRTRAITEAVVVFLAVTGLSLFLGIQWAQADGIYVALGAFSLGGFAQLAWLWIRSRPTAREMLTPAGEKLHLFDTRGR